MNMKCRICGNSAINTTYVAREMMFGFRDEFEYFQCSNCECLQIAEIPENLDKYYPANYFSFSKPKKQQSKTIGWFVKRQRMNYLLTGNGIIGKFLVKLFGYPNLPDWAKHAGLGVDTKILDVGCGAGQLLNYLQKKGFSNLTGFDPYVDQDCHYKNGVQIFKKELDESDEFFEFIMMHHSFEHVPDPINTFNSLHEKLTDNGLALIRIPVVSSFAWNHYKTNWVQLDAPRHLYLHSVKSMALLAVRAGFVIESIEFDSNELQFWGSEQYIRDIPIRDNRSYKYGIDGSIFTEDDIQNYKKRAKELNIAEEGDQACFLLRKKI